MAKNKYSGQKLGEHEFLFDGKRKQKWEQCENYEEAIFKKKKIEDEVNNTKQEVSEVATYSVTNTIKKCIDSNGKQQIYPRIFF